MAMSDTLDSCDASGEYTTGESDAEKQSETSEDPQSSIATCCHLVSKSASEEILEETPTVMETSTPIKVQLRNNKSKPNGPRPWSVSCITQISKRTGLQENSENMAQFSISETALHQLVSITPAKAASLDTS